MSCPLEPLPTAQQTGYWQWGSLDTFLIQKTEEARKLLPWRLYFLKFQCSKTIKREESEVGQQQQKCRRLWKLSEGEQPAANPKDSWVMLQRVLICLKGELTLKGILKSTLKWQRRKPMKKQYFHYFYYYFWKCHSWKSSLNYWGFNTNSVRHGTKECGIKN